MSAASLAVSIGFALLLSGALVALHTPSRKRDLLLSIIAIIAGLSLGFYGFTTATMPPWPQELAGQ